MADGLMHTTCLLCGKHAVSVPWGLEGLPYANYSYCQDCIHKGMKLLKTQKAVEPTVSETTRPVFNGRFWECEECNGRYKDILVIREYKYCPLCGEKLRGGIDGQNGMER